jgi:hypothetical protein
MTSGTLTTNLFEFGAWTMPEETLEPGEGAFVLNPTSRRFTVTFAGEPLSETLTNSIPAGLSIRSSMSYRNGRLSTDLKLFLSPFDNVYRWNGKSFDIFTFLPSGNWVPTEPVVQTTQAFVINSAKSTNWIIQANP